MEESKREKPYNIGGINPVLLSCIMVMLVALSSAVGYVYGIANFGNIKTCNVDVELKSDSALIDVIRGQLMVEMEMLKVINEKTTQKAPTVNNIIKPRPSFNKPDIANSFNNNIIRIDSLSK